MALYARMSFNNNGWITPSGSAGKSPNAGNHEYDYGFGFEEWFFNERRFRDEKGNDCHFAYLDPLRDFSPLIHNEEEELVLYTLQRIPNVPTQRFIIARLPKGHWRFITHERYIPLRDINAAGINSMRDELSQAYNQPTYRQGLQWDTVEDRFENQRDCRNEEGLPTNTSRLWNIELLQPIEQIKQLVTNELECPDWHINTFMMFQLYDSESPNWNHEKCGRNQ